MELSEEAPARSKLSLEKATDVGGSSRESCSSSCPLSVDQVRIVLSALALARYFPLEA